MYSSRVRHVSQRCLHGTAEWSGRRCHQQSGLHWRCHTSTKCKVRAGPRVDVPECDRFEAQCSQERCTRRRLGARRESPKALAVKIDRGEPQLACYS